MTHYIVEKYCVGLDLEEDNKYLLGVFDTKDKAEKAIMFYENKDIENNADKEYYLIKYRIYEMGLNIVHYIK